MPRKSKIHHYIYRTTCQVTGKFYVGMHSTNNLNDGYFGSGKILRYSIAKHGKRNHVMTILESCPTREALKIREAEIVNCKLLSDPLCMNLKYGGEGGQSSAIAKQNWAKPEFIERHRQASAKLWTDPEYINKHKASIKASWQDGEKRKNRLDGMAKNKGTGFTGRKHSEATKKKMSMRVAQTGEKNSQFGTCWVFKETALKIKKEFIEQYIENGYQRGRINRAGGV